ncbi:winged helix DNA-binding domain-containing protein [Paenibacillus swuensis]|uniref:winged helix DNA-binding domain-containing protein n=1 Tax=Paenibacillus swuensis TaxID=1178515 RepID=UPI000A993FDC|nr:winged helix DNA-binding domain-containing protein [Paenibacillus swuensis]
MKSNTLSTRALNRALLKRQLLLERSPLAPLEALEHLVGLQAQWPNPPYVGLWSRLENFKQSDLSELYLNRKVVRIALMRSTIHLVSAKDCIGLRPLLQPVHERGLTGSFGRKLAGVNREAIASAGRALVEESPRTYHELGRMLREQWPLCDPEALAAVVRTYVPLVQVPPRGLWGEIGQAAHTSAETWLTDVQIDNITPFGLEDVVMRYLTAFGPASVKDIQVWCGLTGLREVVDGLKNQLCVYKDERGTELFDIPDTPLPDADTPAPMRFLGEFDNMLLSYADRSRIISETDRPLIFTKNGIIRSAILVDGIVAGLWSISVKRSSATLLIEPFRSLTSEQIVDIEKEGSRLLSFIAPNADALDIQIPKS